jgi:hypothetical protein
MITREQFQAECDKLQKPEDLENLIKLTEKKKKTIKIFSFIVFIAFAILTFLTMNWFLILAGAVLIISGIGIISLIYEADFRKIKLKYASQVVDCLLKDYKYSYSELGHIQESIFRNSPFWTYYEDFKGEDLLTIDIPNDDGTPSGVILQACDIKTTKTETYEDSDGDTHTRTVTVYNGVFGCIKFPFGFKCNLGLDSYDGGLKRIELEDMKFNDKFHTYTDNQLEALMILTPTLMQKLIEFNDKFTGFKLFLKENGEFYFGMDRNMFEIKIPKKGKPFHYIFDKFYDDVKAILEIVEEIKNNNKIFKM